MPNLPYISPETHSKIKSIPSSEYTNTQLIFFKNIHDQEIVYNFNADIQKNVIKVFGCLTEFLGLNPGYYEREIVNKIIYFSKVDRDYYNDNLVLKTDTFRINLPDKKRLIKFEKNN
jgi:hypothetical protein